MITRVQAKNFKSFREIDVELGPLTVFVGRNASGKSNFVDVLRFVRDALTNGLDKAISERGGYAAIAFKQGLHQAENFEIAITMAYENTTAIYRFRIGSQEGGGYTVQIEEADIDATDDIASRDVGLDNDDDYTARRHFGFYIKDGEIISRRLLPIIDVRHPLGVRRSDTELHLAEFVDGGSYVVTMWRQLRQCYCYHVIPDTFRPPQQYEATQTMDDKGDGLTSALEKMLAASQNRRRIVSSLSQVVEDISNIEVRKLGSYRFAEIEHKTALGKEGSSAQEGTWIDLARESEGTLHVLSLLVGLYQERRPGWVLAFEEPEISIHIGALQLFYELFEEAALTRQIIVTTHSPDFIAQCKVDELRVVERVNGESKIGRLLESQIEAINEELFNASDLIRIQGLRREEDHQEIAHA